MVRPTGVRPCDMDAYRYMNTGLLSAELRGWRVWFALRVGVEWKLQRLRHSLYHMLELRQPMLGPKHAESAIVILYCTEMTWVTADECEVAIIGL